MELTMSTAQQLSIQQRKENLEFKKKSVRCQGNTLHNISYSLFSN